MQCRSTRTAIAALVAAIACLLALGATASAHGASASATKKKAGGLTKAQVIALIKQYSGQGPQGTQGTQGPKGDQGVKGDQGEPGGGGGGAPSGPAGGALTGAYPNPTLAAGSVGTSNFAAGATAPNATLFGGFLPSVFQKDVSGSCTAGNAIRDIATDGTVTCEAVGGGGGGGGTVTSVGSGTGLTGGPITTSGTLSVDPTVVQSRVSNSCGAGEAMTAIAQNGTATCAAAGGGGSFPATLPSGSTETGTWGFATLIQSFDAIKVAASLAIPTKGRIASTNVIWQPTGFTAAGTTDAEVATHCPGTVNSPKAVQGYFCLYGTELSNVQASMGLSNPNPGTNNPDPGVFLNFIGDPSNTTGDLDGTNVIHNVAEMAKLFIGKQIYDVTTPVNIPYGTTVTALDSPNPGDVTLSAPAAGTATGDSLNMGPRSAGGRGSFAVTAP